MKRSDFIFSLALLCGACSSENDIPVPDAQNFITFAVPEISMTGIDVNVSRSPLLTTDQLTSFEVAGFCIPRKVGATGELNYNDAATEWKNKAAYSTADVFGNSTVTVTVNGDATTYPNTREWYENVPDPWEAKYAFIAWANGSFTPSSLSTPQAPSLIFEMPFNGGNSNTSRNHTDVTDAVIASTFDRTRRQGKVNLRFEHILTGIRFRFRNYTSERLTITGLSLDGQFYNKAKLSFDTDKMKQEVESLTSSSFSGVFNLVTTANPQTVQPNSAAMLNHDNGEELTILLLPNPAVDPTNSDSADQYALGANKNIKVTYRIGNGAETTRIIENFHLSYNPAQSTRHTATLNFIGDEFTLVFQAENNDVWQNGSDNDIEIN